MGRGMSELQKTILRRALSNKIREQRDGSKGYRPDRCKIML
jgi:hypothetical protein